MIDSRRSLVLILRRETIGSNFTPLIFGTKFGSDVEAEVFGPNVLAMLPIFHEKLCGENNQSNTNSTSGEYLKMKKNSMLSTASQHISAV